MQNERRSAGRKGANIEESLLEFAVRAGKATDALPDTRLGRHIAAQLVRSGTSPAPSYNEACATESKKDFYPQASDRAKGDARESRLDAHDYQVRVATRTTLRRM